MTQRHLYVSNNNSNSISSYTIANDGSLTLAAMAAATSNGPNDMAIVTDSFKTSLLGRGNVYLYANNSLDGTVGAWKVNTNGTLTPIAGQPYGALPANDGAQGIAAY